MQRPNRTAGFTLIEILVAMVVLVVGLVGILVLFPVGIANTTYAMGDTAAANLAESVYNAMIAAHRLVVLPLPGAAAGSRSTVVLVHDLSPANDGTDRCKFELPLETDGATSNFCVHPNAGTVGALKCTIQGTGQDVYVFTLGTNPWMYAAVQDVQDNSDPTESYKSYAFSFLVRKLPTIPAGGNSGLYEYNIDVYRLIGVGPSGGGGGGGIATGGGGGGGGGGSTTTTGSAQDCKHVARVSGRVSGP